MGARGGGYEVTFLKACILTIVKHTFRRVRSVVGCAAFLQSHMETNLRVSSLKELVNLISGNCSFTNIERFFTNLHFHMSMVV
jgi:hypothetical protein